MSNPPTSPPIQPPVHQSIDGQPAPVTASPTRDVVVGKKYVHVAVGVRTVAQVAAADLPAADFVVGVVEERLVRQRRSGQLCNRLVVPRPGDVRGQPLLGVFLGDDRGAGFGERLVRPGLLRVPVRIE
jgi:hypothetical protein